MSIEKFFMTLKKCKNLSISEIKKLNKSLNELKKVLKLKNFVVILKVLIMKTSIIIIMILLMIMNIDKLGVLEHYLKSLLEIITNQ